jgi:RNA polymerase sigma-70 factor (ECF subfamily)
MATTLPLVHEPCDEAQSDVALERELAVGLHAGRRDAFERLYEQYRTRIYNLALRIVQSHEDARDITQEVFIKAYRLLPGMDASLQIKPWLYRVAVNACYDHLRTRKVHSDIDEAPNDTRAVHIDTYEQAELGHQFEQTMARLSERHRTVLLLKDVHGLHHDEIASILGVSKGATETLLFRARAAFRATYAALTPELPAGRCDLARRAAVAAVGGELAASERRKIMVHAQTCPDCRETVKTWGVAAVGLGLFLHSVPLPASLQGSFFGGAAGAGTAGGAAGAGAAGAGGSSTAAVAGGFAAKVGALVATKVAVLAAAATVAAAGTGVTAYELHSSQTSSPAHEPSVTAATETTAPALLAASMVGASQGRMYLHGKAPTEKTKADGKSANGKAKGKSKQAAGKTKDGKGSSEKSNHGKGKGSSGKADKAAAKAAAKAEKAAEKAAAEADKAAAKAAAKAQKAAEKAAAEADKNK